MLTIIYAVTDKDEVLMLNTHTGEKTAEIVSPEQAEIYRKRLTQEIMIQIYSFAVQQ